MEQSQVQDEAQALIQMYYAGFYDAVNEYGSRRRANGWKKHCIDCFDKRFKKKIINSINTQIPQTTDTHATHETLTYTQTLSREKVIKV